jgi:hypothetical protein
MIIVGKNQKLSGDTEKNNNRPSTRKSLAIILLQSKAAI